MFDDDLMRGLVERADAFQRALVATLCMNRAAVLTSDDRADREVAGLRRLIDDSLDYCRARALGAPPRIGPELLATRFREILGPDDLPFEEPGGIAAWFIDVVSIADYVVRTWNEPHASDSRCFDVLVACYSLAGMLQDDPLTPSSCELAELETAQQISDLRAVDGLAAPIGQDRLGALLAQSQSLRESYARRFQDVAFRPSL
ncbi:hypothetical protein [Nocardia africana]